MSEEKKPPLAHPLYAPPELMEQSGTIQRNNVSYPVQPNVVQPSVTGPRNDDTATNITYIPTMWPVLHPMQTFNKKVAVEPFPDMSVKISTHGSGQTKLAKINNNVTLVKLKVLCPNEDYKFLTGDVVLVRGNNFAQPWAKDIYEMEDGTRYILLPENLIEARLRKY